VKKWRHGRWQRLTAGLIAAASAFGCGERTEPHGAISFAEALAPGATAALNSADQFDFADPTGNVTGPKQIPRAQAIVLAKAFVSGFGSTIRSKLEGERGDTVNTAGLTPCRRTLYARSPFLPLSADFVGANPELKTIQRAFGSFWLVPFCDASGSEAALIAVSAYNTDLQVTADGLRMPSSGGGWFLWQGVRKGQAAELPIGPESATILGRGLTGRRIAAVPELIIPSPGDGAAWDGRWRLNLTDSVSVQLEGLSKSRRVSTLYVGYRPRRATGTIDVPANGQPEGTPFSYRGDWSDPTSSRRQLTIRRDPTLPVAFDVVITATAP
jgi:hypothetical protein